MATNGTAMQPIYQDSDLPWQGRELDVIKQLIAPGLTDLELLVFGRVCKHTGLDPFQKQIYAIKRQSNGVRRMTIQTAIDGYRVLAARTGQLAGIDDAVYDVDEAGEPTAAHVTVWRMVEGQRCPFGATARMREYRPAPGMDHMWQKMPYLMIAKCAEALALRKAFPAELSGIYTDTEMMQADAPEPAV